jgi:hypothetical protein
MSAAVADLLAAMAAQISEQFAGGRHGRVRGSSVVHNVHLERWLGKTITVPAPACRVGISGFDVGALTPTDDPVTCARCRHTASRNSAAAAGAEQLTLWPPASAS